MEQLFEEGRVVIPSRMPVEPSWKRESDASLSLKFALGASNPPFILKPFKRAGPCPPE